MRKFMLAVCVFVLLLSSALAEDALVKEPEALAKKAATRYVPSGIARTVWFLYGAYADCSPWDSIEVRTTKEPEHGTVEIVPGEGFGQFAQNSVSAKCNGKKMRGLNVDYKSSGRYLGPDEFDLLVLWPNGFAWEMHFNMIVR
jgi:hypothetical protein